MSRKLVRGFWHGPYPTSVQVVLWGSVCLAFSFLSPRLTKAQQPEWIWSPQHTKTSVPFSTCHFRKTIFVRGPHSGKIEVAADDAYEVFVNGQRVTSGDSWQRFLSSDITKHLRNGENVVAIKVTNRTGPTAGLAARVTIHDNGKRQRVYVTNSTWRTSLRPLPLWHLPQYSDRRWVAAQSFGPWGSTEPWRVTANAANATQENRDKQLPSASTAESTKLRIVKGFQVQHVMGGEETGSLIAMAFDEQGRIIASRENGPLLLIEDTNRDNVPDAVHVYCDRVESCQGILAYRGAVYVTGQGPAGAALYRLLDKDGDGRLEDVRALVRFVGDMGEHGPHGLAMGPDGLIYVVLGNHASAENEIASTSPLAHIYEGDLLGPRYEDPSGHARGIRAPGGVIIRVDTEGKTTELVAGGLRNAYDLTFDVQGELLTHDSDMESDIGTPWHRPTRVCHVLPGAEFGWRSGWSKWPDYFIDSLPGILDTGRGSPAGLVVYSHTKYPERYRHALFSCDWAQGRIDVIRLAPHGASYTARRESFLEGEPLNVTDIDVGPDGWLYFTTGGRGTRGNLYRVVWTGPPAARRDELGTGVLQAIRQPQGQSAWGRYAVMRVRQNMGASWDKELTQIVRDGRRNGEDRSRGLALMQRIGPQPTPSLLQELSRDPDATVRAKCAQLMGLTTDQQTHGVLVKLLADNDPLVRRRACEALARDGQAVPITTLRPLLVSEDRFESWAARKLLERSPDQHWHDVIFQTRDLRLLIQGATAIMVSAPNRERARKIVQQVLKLGQGLIRDGDFVDILRVLQLAELRGGITRDEVSQLLTALAGEYPSKDPIVNRELVRLLVFFQVSTLTDRFIDQLHSRIGAADKVHLATSLRFLNSGWTTRQKLQLLEYYDDAMNRNDGSSLPAYLRAISRDFADSLSQDQRRHVLAEGYKIPNAALAALYGLPEQLDEDWIDQIIELDLRIASKKGTAYERLRIGLVATLGGSSEAAAQEYLREIHDRDPERRPAVAMSLAQHPEGRNWDYLVRSIAILEGAAAKEVLVRLRDVDFAPDQPEHYRQVILRGLKLKDEGATDAVALLEHWTGETRSRRGSTWSQALAAWQSWYHSKHPQLPRAELPVETGTNRWSFHDLLGFLSGEEGSEGSATRGAKVYAKAQCAKCHRFGNVGESLGPDLTTVSKRFQMRETLESIVYPSHVISDQYAAKSILTDDGRTFTGLLVPGAAGEVVLLQPDGEKKVFAKDRVDEIVPSRMSAMPEGLLNELTLKEIADLFAFLAKPPRVNLTQRPRGRPSR